MCQPYMLAHMLAGSIAAASNQGCYCCTAVAQVDRRQECWKVVNATVQGLSEWMRLVPDSKQCHITPLQPKAVKQCLRGKNIIFLGDSLARNQQQSLQCLLMEDKEPPRQYRWAAAVATSTCSAVRDFATVLSEELPAVLRINQVWVGLQHQEAA